MRKVSTTIALAALVGAMSLSTPVEAKSSHKKSITSFFSKAHKHSKKITSHPDFKAAKHAVEKEALSIGSDWLRSKLGL